MLAAQAQSESDMFSELEQWIAEHLKTDLRVEALAEQVHTSPRNFARLYVKTRGRTPAKTVEAIRIDAARRRLEETADRIEAVAEKCGFSDEEQMRLSFIRVLGIPPRGVPKACRLDRTMNVLTLPGVETTIRMSMPSSLNQATHFSKCCCISSGEPELSSQ